MQRPYEHAAYDTRQPSGAWWADSTGAPPPCPAAEGDITCDFAIIGAGYTGLNAALQLAEAHGAQALVLEAGQPGFGGAGRNGGFACMGGAKAGWPALIRRFGPDETRAYLAAQVAAVNRVEENLARYDITADRHSEGELELAHSPRAFRAMGENAHLLAGRLGHRITLIPPGELAERGIGGGFHGGALNAVGFALNPLKYLHGLLRAAQAAGASVHGDSPVLRAVARDGGFLLETPRARISARRLIVATNGYSSDDIPQALAGRFLPAMSSVLVTRPLSTAERRGAGWTSNLMAYDSRSLLHYFRLMPDGRFLFGQRGALRATRQGLARAARATRRDFHAMFPAWRGVGITHQWSGLVCLMRNQAQFAGPLPGLPGAFAALGYHGNGVAMGSHAGRLIGDLAAGANPGIPAVMAAPPRPFVLPSLRRLALAGAYLGLRLTEGRV